MAKIVAKRFARVPAWVALLKLSPTAWRLLIEICKHLDAKNTAYPSLRRMAREWTVSRPNLTRALHELEAEGVLVSRAQTHKRNDGEDRRLYLVNFDPEQRDRFRLKAKTLREAEQTMRTMRKAKPAAQPADAVPEIADGEGLAA